MKALSVLFTVALVVVANGLASHLKRAHALPDRSGSVQQTFLHHKYQF